MTQALEGLAELARHEAERDGLRQQLKAARAHVVIAQQRHEEAQARLAAESEDVTRLESLSMTRILAGLRGTRDSDLSREQAEAQAASYAAAEADARRASAQREVDHLAQRLDAYTDLEERRGDLEARREAEIAADPASGATHARLTELAGRQGALQAESVQLDEALAAAEDALGALGEAARHLGSAQNWADYDTFLGGGMLGDMVKHDRLDRAGALMRHADAALRHLATELADVRVEAVGEVGVTELARTFDVWFDNIFSDWAVRDRIKQASARVDHLTGGVQAVRQELVHRRTGVAVALVELDEGRRALLTA